MKEFEWGPVDGIITNLVYDEEALRFKTIYEFKDALRRGAEITLEWKGVDYYAERLCRKVGEAIEISYYICKYGNAEVYRTTKLETTDLDELLEYKFGEDRLRDIITKVIVVDRTL